MATDKMSYLEPLPCCGMKPFGFEIEGNFFRGWYRLLCPVCRKHFTERSKEKAIERWNKKVVTEIYGN